MGLNIRHGILAAPAGTVGLSAPPPNAGLLPGITRTTYTGPETINTAGTIVRDKDILNNGLVVKANNVQIINCHVSGGFFTIQGDASGLVVDHCLVDNAWWGANSCIAPGDGWTVTNCRMTGSENGMMFGSNGLCQGNYIYGLGTRGDWTNNTAYPAPQFVNDLAQGTIWKSVVAHTSATTGTFAQDRAAHPTYWSQQGPHVDGCQTTGASNVQFLGNWIESWDTSCIFLKCDDGPIDTILIEGNTLICDPIRGITAAAVYAYSVGAKLCTNVTVRNNRVQKGVFYFNNQNSTPVYSGNVDYVTGAPVTG